MLHSTEQISLRLTLSSKMDVDVRTKHVLSPPVQNLLRLHK